MNKPNIPRWADLNADQRADAVLGWCQLNGIDTSSIIDYQLAAAMAEATKSTDDSVPFEPSPMDYVDVVRVLAAFLRSRI